MGEWSRYLEKAGVELLTGGKADDKTNSDFSSKQIAMGKKVEREHTNSEELANEITRDHLEEIPDYYTRLDRMEEEAKAQMKKSANVSGAVESAGKYLASKSGKALGKGLAVVAEGVGFGIGIGAGEHALNTAIKPKKKHASVLDQALGVLYAKYGPPLQKHAALTFFNYTADKAALDREALGSSFCKLAAASQVDPWVMARNIVSLYPQLEKMASLRGPEGEVARFYLSWAAEMEKKAGLVDTGIKAFRAAKAGIGAAVPKSSKSLMNSAIQASEKGLEVAPRQSVGQAVKGSLAQSNALQQAGGGSIRRGQQLAKADSGLMQATKSPVMHPGTPPAAVGGGAPMAGKPAIQGAPPAAPAAGAQAPVGKKGVNWKHVGIGAATVGGTAYALPKMMGSGEPQQSFVN